MKSLIIRYSVATVACIAVGGCTTSAWQSIAEAETFNFRYVVATPSSVVPGNWTYQIAMDNGPCQPVNLTDADLKAMLETGVHDHAGVTHTFAPDMLTACNTGRYYLGDTDIKTLRNGLPKRVDIDRVGGGSNPSGIDISVDATQMIVYNSGGPLGPGPMDTVAGAGGAFDVPANIVGASGTSFSPLNGPPSSKFLQFSLSNLLSNPDRITAEFMFAARQSGGSSRLLVWDGEIVLQE